MPTTSININGYALRAIRELTGINQRTLAQRADCTRSHITNIENGRFQRVSPELYTRLLRSLALTDRRVLLADPHNIAPAETQAVA